MGKLGGFLSIPREEVKKRGIEKRIEDFQEFILPLDDTAIQNQAARCMECGVPFCHFSCPVSNDIPEMNDLVYHGKFKEAYDLLETTNCLPELTGRVCPALCEGGCVLAIDKKPITIKNIELFVIEKAFELGLVKPRVCAPQNGKKVAIVGSGPTGLSAAYRLIYQGFQVTVYEKESILGGLLTLGIPDYKIEPEVVNRRLDLLKAEGVKFVVNETIGKTLPLEQLESCFDAVLLSGGSKISREFPVKGRDLKGVYHAMEFLTCQNKATLKQGDDLEISAKNRDVIVIGGGDTGADCVGVSVRQKANSITQLIRRHKPSSNRSDTNPWPNFPEIFEMSTSHCEAKAVYNLGDNDVRQFGVVCDEFIGTNGILTHVRLVDVTWETIDGQRRQSVVENSERIIKADMVLLALGFDRPETLGFTDVALDKRGNVVSDTQFLTNRAHVFTAGDMRIGQSLIVTAIHEGQEAAKAIEAHLLSKK